MEEEKGKKKTKKMDLKRDDTTFTQGKDSVSICLFCSLGAEDEDEGGVCVFQRVRARMGQDERRRQATTTPC